METIEYETQTRKISFVAEDLDPWPADTEESDKENLQTAWEEDPPVRRPPMVKVHSRKYLTQTPQSDKAKTICRVVSLVSLIVAITCVFIVMLIPQLCYFKAAGICQHTESPSAPSENNDTDNLKICSAISYSGVCQSSLNGCSNSLINLNKSLVLESQLSNLFMIVNARNEEPSCSDALEELKVFLCQYSYQPCDDDYHVILPTRDQCEYFRDVACREGWNLLLSSYYSYLLPDCARLPSNTTIPNCNMTITSTMTTSTVIPSVTPTSTIPTPSDDSNATDQCTVSYSGSVCQSHLSLCAGSDIDIESFDQNLESSLSTASGFLVGGSSCGNNREMVLDFLCLYAFHPCDDDNVIHLPNRTTCEYIRDNICQVEWNFLNSFNNGQYAALLPNCSLLPVTSSTPSCVNIPQPSATLTTTPTATPAATPSECNEVEGFYLYVIHDNTSSLIDYNNTCQAQCDKWIIFESTEAANIRDYAMFIAISVGMVAAVAVIFFSVVRYKKMFAFPSMFILYQTITLMVLGITLLIQYMDRYSLSCPSDNLVSTAFNMPTTFCSFSGFILLYAIFSLTFWWFVHVSCTFWKVMFPFHAREHERKTKYIHIVLLIVGILLPAVPPLVALLTEGYVLYRLPPVLCTTRDNRVIYYGIILPVSIVLCIGISFILIILHVLHQKQGLFKHRRSTSYFLGLTTAEKKLLLLFAYYIILVAVSITSYSLAISGTSGIKDAITKEFTCEWFPRPHDPNFKCPKDYLTANIADELSVMTFILLGLFPCLNLLYAINFTEIKSKCHACYKRFSSLSGDYPSKPTSSTSAAKSEDSPFSLRRRLSFSFFNDGPRLSVISGTLLRGLDIPLKEQNGVNGSSMANGESKGSKEQNVAPKVNGITKQNSVSAPDLTAQIKLTNSTLLIYAKERTGSVDISRL